MKTRLWKIIFAILLCGFLPAVSCGQQITIGLTGKVSIINDPLNVFNGQIHHNDTVTGTYTYDTSTQDSDPEGYSGIYRHYNSPCGVSININNFNFRTDPNNVQFKVGIGDNYPGFGDIYSFISYNNSPLLNGALVDSIIWQLTDSTGTVLSSDALPTTAPNLDDWSVAPLDIHGGQVSKYYIAIEVTSAALIPEPATLLLLAFGVAICRRR